MSALERPPGAPNGSGSAIDPGAIQVVVGCDDKYACHLGVMLLSLFAHSKALPVHVHVMVPEGFSARPRLQQALAGHTRMLTYHVLAGDAVEGLKQRNDLTAATYYRLLMSDVLPSDVTRVIYLDCDIMLRCDLVDLWRFSLGNAVAAAVPDPGFRHRQILGLPDDAPYFNGGVLLIDLDRWRGEAIGQNALAFATAHPDRLTYNDQCALNWALQGRWLVLDQAWNVQTANLSRIIQGEVHYFQPTPPFAAGARIVHFNAPGRPWLYMDDHPFKLDYLAYKKRTPCRLLSAQRHYQDTAATCSSPAANLSPDSGVYLISFPQTSLTPVMLNDVGKTRCRETDEMGIDLHGLRLLQYAANKTPLGEVATLGRQNIHLSSARLRETLQLPSAKQYGPFCEELLIEQFGAVSVTSFDASEYEKASVRHDMNQPLDHDRQYDTVIDLGTLEHVFNLAVALKNVAALCRPGGRIIHALPANNYNGHGFWQFSPELFFSLYSASNGFADTEVYIAELDDERNWWKAAVPANGVRVEYTSANRSYVLALTRKQAVETDQTVQQSDYVMQWEHGPVPIVVPAKSVSAAIHQALKRIPLIWRLADVVVPMPDTHRDAWVHRLSASNRHYTKVALSALVPLKGLTAHA